MSNYYLDTDAKAGVAGGMVCTLLSTVNSSDIIKTTVLATVGAVISFGVSLLLKRIVAVWNRRK
jgi:hypothetical protein